MFKNKDIIERKRVAYEQTQNKNRPEQANPLKIRYEVCATYTFICECPTKVYSTTK